MVETRRRFLAQDERDYAAVLMGIRLSQLYAFWLLLEVLPRPILLLFGLVLSGAQILLAWALGQTPPPIDLDPLFVYLRHWTTILLLAAAAVYFWYHSQRRFSWIAVAAGGIAVLGNLWHAYRIISGPYFGISVHQQLAGAGLDFETVEALRWSIFAFWALAHVQFLYLGFRAHLAVHGMDERRRREMSEYAEVHPSVLQVLSRLLFFPGALRFARRRVAASAAMLIAGVLNFINYSVALAAIFWGVILTGFALGFQRGSVILTGAEFAGVLIGVFLLLRVVPWLLSRFARWMRGLAERLMRRSLEEAQADDARQPILFLRSFLNDQVPLPAQRGSAAWAFDGVGRRSNLDHIVLAEGSEYGPTVALGDPSDEQPPYGVARGYFDHGDWQAAVAGLCDSSQAIIMVLDKTEGVAWEIGHLAAKGHLRKTLFLLAPEDAGQPDGSALASAVLGGAPDPEGLMGFEIDEKGDVTLLVSATRSTYSYQLAVRSFLRRVSCSDAA